MCLWTKSIYVDELSERFEWTAWYLPCLSEQILMHQNVSDMIALNYWISLQIQFAKFIWHYYCHACMLNRDDTAFVAMQGKYFGSLVLFLWEHLLLEIWRYHPFFYINQLLLKSLLSTIMVNYNLIESIYKDLIQIITETMERLKWH